MPCVEFYSVFAKGYKCLNIWSTTVRTLILGDAISQLAVKGDPSFWKELDSRLFTSSCMTSRKKWVHISWTVGFSTGSFYTFLDLHGKVYPTLTLTNSRTYRRESTPINNLVQGFFGTFILKLWVLFSKTFIYFLYFYIIRFS